MKLTKNMKNIMMMQNENTARILWNSIQKPKCWRVNNDNDKFLMIRINLKAIYDNLFGSVCQTRIIIKTKNIFYHQNKLFILVSSTNIMPLFGYNRMECNENEKAPTFRIHSWS